MGASTSMMKLIALTALLAIATAEVFLEDEIVPEEVLTEHNHYDTSYGSYHHNDGSYHHNDGSYHHNDGSYHHGHDGMDGSHPFAGYEGEIPSCNAANGNKDCMAACIQFGKTEEQCTGLGIYCNPEGRCDMPEHSAGTVDHGTGYGSSPPTHMYPMYAW